jgi:aminobenzoyl-glutamate utilization protein B
VFNEQEMAFAGEIRKTLTESERQEGLPPGLAGHELSGRVEPYVPEAGIQMISTDVGDVSWKAPTAQCSVACFAIGTPLHTWQAVSQGAMSIGHKGMLHAGIVIGATAAELLLKPERIEACAAEHRSRLSGRTYHCPIPDGATPGPVTRSK